MEDAPASSVGEDEGSYQTPPRATQTFRRKVRESILSPGSLRASKVSKSKDEDLYERMHIMLRAEIKFMRAEMGKEVLTILEEHKQEMYKTMKKEFDKEIAVMRTQMQKEIKEEIQSWIKDGAGGLKMVTEKVEVGIGALLKWKKEIDKHIEEQNKTVKDLEEKFVTLSKSMEARETTQEKTADPQLQEELEKVKKQMETLKAEEALKTQATSSWAERLFKTQEKVEEAEKWIADAKQGKGPMADGTSTSNIINMTIEEEQKRKTRAMHVRITGVKDSGNVEEEVKGLLQRMGIPEPSHTSAWRVGKKGLDNKGNERDRALILRFPNLEARRDFLKKRPTLKDTGIFLGDDLTLTQVAHMQELMPEIRAAREKGKIAFYRGGRVIVLEKRSNVGSSSA